MTLHKNSTSNELSAPLVAGLREGELAVGMARRWTRGVGAVVLAALVVGACSGDDASDEGGGDADDAGLTVEVVSSRPEYVSGGDALVAVGVPDGVDPADVTVEAGGEDVTDAFAADPDDDARLVGLVEGLPSGESEITAAAGDDCGLGHRHRPPDHRSRCSRASSFPSTPARPSRSGWRRPPPTTRAPHPRR